MRTPIHNKKRIWFAYGLYFIYSKGNFLDRNDNEEPQER